MKNESNDIMSEQTKDKLAKRWGNIPNEWQSLMGGRRLLPALQNSLNESLRQCFGYYGVVLGPLGRHLSFESSPIRHWFHGMHPMSEGDAEPKFAACNFAQLNYQAMPFQSDSVDTLVLPHLLDFVEQPHEVLREIERVMIPDGKVIISGINPLSIYGAKYAGTKLARRARCEKRLIGLSRLKDWLLLLGFSVEDYLGLDRYELLSENEAVDRWVKPVLSHFCSHYVLTAKKEVSTITPIRPSWKSNRKLVPARFAEPSVRHLVDRELKRVQQSIGG